MNQGIREIVSSGASSAITPVNVSAPFREQSGLRVAVVGCGYWGSKHVRVLSAMRRIRRMVLVEPDPEICQTLQRTFATTLAFTSLQEALPHVDALVIATPPQTHSALALMALRAGRHVLIEKPLATSVDSAREVVESARRSGAVLMVGHTFQFNPAVRELRRRLAAGEFGVIHYVHCSRLNLGLYRPDVNVIWDLAPHDISILNFLLGATPAAVTAWGASLASAGPEDLAYIRLEYRQPRVTGYVHLSWLDPRKTRTVTVIGSRKMAVYDDLAEERLRIYDRGVSPAEEGVPLHERPPTYRYGDIVAPHISGEEPLAVQDAHFVDCVLRGVEPEFNGHHALDIIATLEAIDRSLRQRRRVAISETAVGADSAVEGAAAGAWV